METGGKRRRRLLHACGVSALTIAHNACNRAEEVDGSAHRIASLAGPIVSPMFSQWLAILSFADDGILAVENTVETLFPLSAHVFDKIESLVHIPDALPGKFDRAIDMMVVRVPFLRWAFTLLIWGLNLLISAFTDWRPDDAATEKDIMVDFSCNEIACKKGIPINDALNNEDEFAPKSALIHNSPTASPRTGERGDCEDKHLINEPFPSLSAPVGTETEKTSVQGEETMKRVKSTYKEIACKKGLPINDALNNEDEFAPKSDLIHNSPTASPRTGERGECEDKHLINEHFPSLPAPVGTDKTDKTSVQGEETMKRVKSTYKEVLEMGNNGDVEKKQGSVGKKKTQKPMVKVSVGEKEKPTGAEMGGDGPIELSMKDFPILELFDAGWHMKTHRKKR